MRFTQGRIRCVSEQNQGRFKAESGVLKFQGITRCVSDLGTEPGV